MNTIFKRLKSSETGKFFKGDPAMGDGPKEATIIEARLAINPHIHEQLRLERQEQAEAIGMAALTELITISNLK